MDLKVLTAIGVVKDWRIDGMSIISEQVKELRKYCFELDKYGGNFNDQLSHAIHNAIDTIETLSAKLSKGNMERSDRYYNGDWILCSDRLPTKEECGDYRKEFNVTVNAGGIKTLTMLFEYEVVRGKEVCRWKWFGRLSPWEVIAWQPLPEPYKPQ